MHFLFDFIPVVAFFLVYKFSDIYMATAAAMAISAMQILFLWFTQKKLEKGPCITLVALLFLGGATLIFHDESFIKWKPTVIYAVISLFIVGKRYWSKQSAAEQLMGDKVLLAAAKWRVVDQVTLCFFLAMAVLNWWVAFTFDTTTWVHFKLFGVLALTLIYCIALSCYIAKHAEEIESNEPA
jgi:intracellular septation protein